MSACEEPELKQLLYRFVRQELESGRDRQRVRAHLETCAECGAVFQELQWVMGSMRGSSPEEHQKLMSELRRAGGVDTDEADTSDEPVAPGGLLSWLKRWLSRGGA